MLHSVPPAASTARRSGAGMRAASVPATNLLWKHPTLPTPYSLRGHVRHIHRRLVTQDGRVRDRDDEPAAPSSDMGQLGHDLLAEIPGQDQDEVGPGGIELLRRQYR